VFDVEAGQLDALVRLSTNVSSLRLLTSLQIELEEEEALDVAVLPFISSCIRVRSRFRIKRSRTLPGLALSRGILAPPTLHYLLVL
jgi:hypothetical protein